MSQLLDKKIKIREDKKRPINFPILLPELSDSTNFLIRQVHVSKLKKTNQ